MKRRKDNFLKTISVYVGCKAPKNGIRGIRLLFMDGQLEAMGTPCGTLSEFTFAPGETLVGDLTLGGNGVGTRLGHISFKTSSGRRFSAGDLHTPYLFNVDGLYITGAYGKMGGDIDNLGFIYSKKIKNAVLTNVAYPTLATIKSGLQPKIILDNEYCNDHEDRLSLEFDYAITEGIDQCWGIETTHSFGASFSVSAGLPKIAEVQATAHWEVSITNTHNSCKHETITRQTKLPVTIPPLKTCKAKLTHFESPLKSLPYTGTLVVTFTDDSSYQFPVAGRYSGTYFSSTKYSFTCNNSPQTCNSRRSAGVARLAGMIGGASDPTIILSKNSTIVVGKCDGRVIRSSGLMNDCFKVRGQCCSVSKGGPGTPCTNNTYPCEYCYSGKPRTRVNYM